ncbi:MAG: coenzyme F420-0:L-glutamate ligase [Candidatus Asgardarchaeia archaeon]
MKEIRIIGLTTIPIVKVGDSIAKLIVEAAKKENVSIDNKDIIVIAQTIVSKSEGRVIKLSEVTPSPLAITIAKQCNKDPRHVEIILRESKSIVRMARGLLITETHHGFVMANSGVDKSNTPEPDSVTLLPLDPDKSARRIHDELFKYTGKNVAVIITDSMGRPLRNGIIAGAIGVAGIKPLKDFRGHKDLFGYELKSTIVAIADELACAAALLMGEANEGVPVVIVKGLDYTPSEGSAKDLIMPIDKDLFR